MTCELGWSDKPHEECGVFGIYAPGEAVARLTFFGLYALQHRGQESAGIAVTDGVMARLHKDMGLVSQVFNEENLAPLQGHIAIGHTRYSTADSSRPISAGPFLVESMLGPLALAHNGNLINTGQLRRKLFERGVGLSSSCDSEVIIQMLAGAQGDSMLDRIQDMMSMALGAYALTILTRDALYAVRDPWGFRPLSMGRLSSGWVVASESCALETVGAQDITEIGPGEIVMIDANGARTIQGRDPERSSLCIFEFIYFARPDSIIDGQLVHDARQELGRQLAREHPVEADLVMGVPDSATAAAIGYAQESHIPYGEGLIKNRYIGRTFIQPDDRLRKSGVALKFNPLAMGLKGKRLIVVDDSIVRGNTSAPTVELLRRAGAAEVHMRISSPPIKHPCFMGVDMATYGELIAHRMNLEQIRAHVGADSLGFLSQEGMLQALKRATGHYCTACFSGDYPFEQKAGGFLERELQACGVMSTGACL
ncbi:MAG: amidophosphoribosyltransferase [Anaerolineae bacterium]|jgi:amidophosphoribosyltransferase|nr:amidophosphoribosyltransferase [Chloroflexota bacterium]